MRKTAVSLVSVVCLIALCFSLCACADKGNENAVVPMENDLSVDEQSDIGLYFFASDGSHVRYSEDISTDYFDPQKPTIAFFHGWMTEDFEDGEIYEFPEFNKKVLEAGYNMCALDYCRHAKVLTYLFNYIWMGYEDSHSIACRFAREYAACFKNYDKEVTFLAHSFGAHTSVATAYFLSKMADQGIVGRNCLPKRMTFTDPYLGDVLLNLAGGIKGDTIENLGEKINGRSCTEVIADAMQYLADRENIAIDVYCGMPVAYDQYLEEDDARRQACKKKLYDTGAWTILKGLQNEFGTVGDIHMYTLYWVFESFFVSEKCVDGQYFPTASLDNDKMRALKGKLFESTLEGLDVANDTLVEAER